MNKDATATPVDTSDISVRELAISAGGRSVHVVDNANLGVIIDRGQKDKAVDTIPHNLAEIGSVLVTLDVSGDHDEVHYECEPGVDGVELLSEALASLTVARDALVRVSKA